MGGGSLEEGLEPARSWVGRQCETEGSTADNFSQTLKDGKQSAKWRSRRYSRKKQNRGPFKGVESCKETGLDNWL